MPEIVSAHADQAAGLRRLFRAPSGRAVAFVSGREACGRTRLLVQTAAALAQSGETVLVIDENSGTGSVHDMLGLRPLRDLAEAASNPLATESLVQPATRGIAVASAARLAAHGSADPAARRRLDAVIRQLLQAHSYVLVDCADRANSQPSPLMLASPWVAVVVAAETSAITRAYATIKRLARDTGRNAFHVVVTRARSEIETRAVFGNLQRTAREHLGVRLDFLAGVPQPATDHLAGALNERLGEPAAQAVAALP